MFTGVSAIAALSEKLKVEAELDAGRQDRGAVDGSDSWTGGVVAARWALTPRVALVGRGEWYSDAGQVIIVTGGPDAFKATGGSLGLDVSPGSGFVWRTEVRALRADADLFADRDGAGGLSKSNLVLVSAFTFRP